MKRVQIHCFVTDIPIILQAFVDRRNTLTELDLTLTNIAHSPSLERILTDKNGIIEKLPENAFPLLTNLSIDSSHLSHVHLGGILLSSQSIITKP